MLIYHMLPAADWAAVPASAPYAAASLARAGFIHCSGSRADLLRVANSIYRDQPGDWLILAIDAAAVAAPVRWEEADGSTFPHIYGALNRSAVVEVVPFARAADGAFVLPQPPALP